MVDPEAIEHAAAMQVQEQRVRPVEHLGIFDPKRDQGVDVEEPAVAEQRPLLAPATEQVVLPPGDRGDVAAAGSVGDGEDVAVVAQHGLVAVTRLHLVERKLTGVDDLGEACPQNRQT